MEDEIWILGGTGRSGRAIAAELAARGRPPVLVGRNAERLAAEAARSGGGRTIAVDSLPAMATEITRQGPAVVINTVGPFAATALPIIRACLPASHYIDLANDVGSVAATLAGHDQAAAAGRTVVTAAGFGATAAESIVLRLRADRPDAAKVRVDVVPSFGVEKGVMGEALAASILDGLPGVEGGRRYQGRRIENGRLVPARIGADAAPLTLPDGTRVTTAGWPSGELLAAQRASGAPSVIAASSELPTSPLTRALMPVAMSLLEITPIRAFATRRLAEVSFEARERPREFSWAHALLEWPDGTRRAGWLRVGDAQAYTGAVPAEVAVRLAAGGAPAGAHTPAVLFGPGLAEACGGTYIVGD
ncbi:hypothetical protein [Allonocardiopsis opalescens]|uniref:Short subunit dehydrogenase-like uncharacterized protein n=1 Tax=Allonocardiopsis opalescens TaxID=1144618 RepID=A0A2T0Q734_9ACTN|nr:hypothetical protein [Allonocardiopsis opalescens]PRX99628.1 short subunit dehydrogenase-like uncharacterized protein [Allonocardiopsis opalescens]